MYTLLDFLQETLFSYESGTINYEYTNFSESKVPAIDVIAVYDKNNSFIGMRTIDGLKTGTNSGTFSVEGDIGSIKFFIWDDLPNMHPYDKIRSLE